MDLDLKTSHSHGLVEVMHRNYNYKMAKMRQSSLVWP